MMTPEQLQIVETLIRSAEPEHPIFGPVIHRYSRADAIADGVLVNLGMFVSEDGVPVLDLIGLRFPVAMTDAAYTAVVGETEGGLLALKFVTRRVVYVLASLKRAILASSGAGTRIDFDCTSAGLPTRSIALKSICGPGDNAEPVITIMLPNED